MAQLLDRISNRLTRIGTSDVPASAIVPTPVVAESDETGEQMTLQTLEAALGRLAAARADQLGIVYGAEAERDRVMDDPDGDDRELLQIQDRVTVARLSIDRIARLEDEALEQLQPLRAAKQQAAWEAARDQFCVSARRYHAAMEELEKAANALWAVRSTVFSPVGLRDWESQVPRLPRLMLGTPAGPVPMDSVSFDQQMQRFSRITINGSSQVGRLADRTAAFVHGRVDAAALDQSTVFGSSSTTDDIEVLVRLTRDISPKEGEVLPRGVVVRVSAVHARELVAAGRAVLSDPQPERGTAGQARTLPLGVQGSIPQSQEN